MIASSRRVLAPAFTAAWLALRPWNRHSLVIATLSTLYLLLGTVWLSTPVTESRRTQLALLLHWSDGSMTPWALIWILIGCLGLLSTRWPPGYDRWGYIVLGMHSTGWGFVALAGPVLYGTPWGIGLAGALVWGAFAFLIWAISGLTAPITAPHPPDLRG